MVDGEKTCVDCYWLRMEEITKGLYEQYCLKDEIPSEDCESYRRREIDE